MHSYRNPVLFTAAATDIPDNALLVEIGPHSILRAPLRQSRPDLSYVGTMKKGECGVASLANAVADMWSNGVPVTWSATTVPTNSTGTECKLACWSPYVFPLAASAVQVLHVFLVVMLLSDLIMKQVHIT